MSGAQPGFDQRPKSIGPPLVCGRDLNHRLNCERENSMD